MVEFKLPKITCLNAIGSMNFARKWCKKYLHYVNQHWLHFYMARERFLVRVKTFLLEYRNILWRQNDVNRIKKPWHINTLWYTDTNAPVTHSRFWRRFTTIRPDVTFTIKSGCIWTDKNWKFINHYNVSRCIQCICKSTAIHDGATTVLLLS